MKAGTASKTAITAASMRAAHLHLFDGPKIFKDVFALSLIGIDDPERLRAESIGDRFRMRGVWRHTLRCVIVTPKIA